jgi:NAD+ synthase
MRASEIATWLRERVTAAGARGLVVGLSGGIDSAVVAALCQMAAADNVVGVILPCDGDPRDDADAQLVADHLRIPTLRIDLAPVYDRLGASLSTGVADLPPSQPRAIITEGSDLRARVPLANIQPRLRMASLYYIANALNYLVAGTGNRCELTIGYFTKYGDGGVDLLPIGSMLKSEVRALGRDLGLPDAIVDKPASAGLWPGQTDEDEIGFTYNELERYLTDRPDGVPPALALRIERLVRQTEHKRAMPPTPLDTPAEPEITERVEREKGTRKREK